MHTLGEHYSLHAGVNGCGVVIATPTGNCYDCQKLIKGPTKLKPGM